MYEEQVIKKKRKKEEKVYPFLDEEVSKQMQEDFLKNRKC